VFRPDAISQGCPTSCPEGHIFFFLARHVAIYNRLQAQKALMMILWRNHACRMLCLGPLGWKRVKIVRTIQLSTNIIWGP